MLFFTTILLQICILYFTSVSCATDYQTEGLNVHNKYRQRHQSPDLNLDDNLNLEAMKCAEHYKNNGKIDHSCKKRRNVGENLAWSSRGSPVDDKQEVTAGIDAWYNEIKDYNFENPKESSGAKTGHFTQLIWKSSTKLGIGVYRKKKRSGKGEEAFVVALYEPAGNVMWGGSDDHKFYKQNVLISISSSSKLTNSLILLSSVLILLLEAVQEQRLT